MQLQSQKLFGDNLTEVFKKKKVNSVLYPCDFAPLKHNKLASPLAQVVPEHFRARLALQKPAAAPPDKQAEVERILTDLLEEHKAAHRPEGSLFSKLHFIEKAIGR